MLEPSALSLNTDTARMPIRARAQPPLNWPTTRSPTIGFVLKVKREWVWSYFFNCINSVSIALFVSGGVLLGGYLVRRFDLKRSLKMAARFCVIASVFTVAGSSAWFIPGCGVPDLAGVTAPYSGRWEKEALKDLTPPQSFSHNFIQRAEWSEVGAQGEMGRDRSACMKTTGDESKIKLVPPCSKSFKLI